eukprot:CAMPEP_0174954886 /NCGR_PEP_ID=MMETSP0004_2-20121128/675_1 /TAXON_ID=420556 /ORGANISM="Ochromonas sp., Strain CCMP1393" /LENGTH=264 /DNA_ID=CAMNT_0016202753 /DNA_START=146 /DNA_END=940 /DNA_ORIENTATION=-
MSLAGKLSLVTGSTSGIGLGIAKVLAQAGSTVVIHGSRSGENAEVKSLLTELSDFHGVKAFYEQANLGSAREIETMIESVCTKSGDSIDILVNNAGIQHISPVESFPVDKWNAIIDINLNSVFHTSRLTLPAMKKKNWGRIINIGSTHSLVGSPLKSAYAAAKHGVLGFTKVAALETARTGVTVNCITPGFVLTPLIQEQIESRSRNLGISIEEAQDILLSEKQPSGQFVTPEQVGKLVAFLASDAASEVRGATWSIDGGWTCV